MASKRNAVAGRAGERARARGRAGRAARRRRQDRRPALPPLLDVLLGCAHGDVPGARDGGSCRSSTCSPSWRRSSSGRRSPLASRSGSVAPRRWSPGGSGSKRSQVSEGGTMARRISVMLLVAAGGGVRRGFPDHGADRATDDRNRGAIGRPDPAHSDAVDHRHADGGTDAVADRRRPTHRQIAGRLRDRQGAGGHRRPRDAGRARRLPRSRRGVHRRSPRAALSPPTATARP